MLLRRLWFPTEVSQPAKVVAGRCEGVSPAASVAAQAAPPTCYTGNGGKMVGVVGDPSCHSMEGQNSKARR